MALLQEAAALARNKDREELLTPRAMIDDEPDTDKSILSAHINHIITSCNKLPTGTEISSHITKQQNTCITTNTYVDTDYPKTYVTFSAKRKSPESQKITLWIHSTLHLLHQQWITLSQAPKGPYDKRP